MSDNFQLEDNETFSDLLNRLAGKSAGIMLKSGQELSGIVKVVGKHGVQLSQLTGREFYDAVIPLDCIEAVIVRAQS